MATTQRKHTVNPAARTRAIAPKTSSRKATHNHPRAIALAVATAFLPWYLPQAAYGQTPPAAPAPNQMPNITRTHGDATVHDVVGTYQKITQDSRSAIYAGSMTMGVNAHLELVHAFGRSGMGLFKDVSGSLTQIFGRITSNGQVFISNQNGVLFGASARVDVGSLFATSLSINDLDFMAGRYNWYNEGKAGEVANEAGKNKGIEEGHIITANGYTALVGPQVRNDGIIVARAGAVTLAAGDRVSIDMIGDGLISLSIDQAAYNASVINNGRIEADGGTVLLSARSANALLDTVINNSGIIRANSLIERNGVIVLDGGNAGVVANTGLLTVAGIDAGTTGGTVKVLGQYVGLFDGTRIDASGDAGGGTVLVGGNFQGKGPEQNAFRTYVGHEVRINADAVRHGDGGKVIVWADDAARFHGSITARGGAQGGDGGFVETSGKGYLETSGARVNASAAYGKAGRWLLDPRNVEIVAAITGDEVPNAGGFFDATGLATAQVEAGDIVAALEGGTDVTVHTGSNGGDQGTIDVNAAITVDLTANGPVSFTLDAAHNINVSQAITATNDALTVNLIANSSNFDTASGTGSVLVGAAITTNGGAFNSSGVGFQSTAAGVISTGGGNVAITHLGDVSIGGAINAGVGTININFGQGNTGSTFTLAAALTGTTKTVTGGTGNDTFDFTGAPSTTATLDGNTGTDTVELTGDTDFTLADGSLTTTSGFNLTLTSIEDASLTGGAGANTFTVSGWTGTATIDGQAGIDTIVATNDVTSITLTDASLARTGLGALTLASINAATLMGGVGDNTITATTFTGAVTVNATAGTDAVNGNNANTTFNGLNAVSTWDTTGTDDGTYTSGANTTSLTDVGNWVGGANNDTFNLAHSVATVAGGDGTNTFNINASITSNLTGGANSDSFIVADGAELTGSVDGTGGSDTLELGAYSTALTFTLNAAGASGANGTTAGTSNPVSGGFSNIDVITGGTNGNTFNVTAAVAANLTGGAGMDVFNIDAVLTGSVSGAGGSDTLQGTQIGSTTLAASTAVDGFSGTTTGVTGFNGINLLNGSGTLTGRDVASTWSVDGATYTDGTATLAHSGFGTLQGGTAIDTFTLGGATTFNLNGGDGVDVFALGGNTLTGAIAGQAAGGSITGIGSPTLTNAGTTTGFDGTSANVSGNFTDITNLSGTGTLTGDDAVSSWAVNGTSGTYTSGNALTFSGFATLHGGTAVDTFTLGGATTFNLNGGDGVDVFALAGNTLTGAIAGQAAGGSITGVGSATLTNQGATTGFDGTSANVSGNFTDITNLSGTGTLTGDDAASSWAVNGTSGTYTSGNALSFSGFATLQGGTAVDTFTLAGATTFNLNGGDGVDVFALATNTLTGSINGQVDGGSITGIGSATLTGTGGTIGYNGTSANVSANFSNITNLSGTGTLTGTNNASVWSALNGTGGSYTDNAGANNVTFSGFATLQGGTAIDTFTLGGATTFNLNGGDGVDVFALATNTLTGSINGQVDGGSITGIGSATLTNQGGTTGFDGTSANVSTGFSNITSLSGTGTLTGDDVASTWDLDGTPTYSDGTRTLAIAGFANLQGGTAIDTFNVTVASAFTLNGGGGVDVFNLNAALTGNIDGQADGGTLDGTNLVNVNLSGAGGLAGYNGSTDAAALTGTFTNITTINANGGGTLTGTNNVSGWSALNGTSGSYTDNAGTNSVGFSNFAALQGGTAIDTFTLGGATTFNLNGGDGVDVFALAGNTLTGAIAGQAAGGSITGIGSPTLTNAGTTTGFDGTSANVSGNFTDITNLSGTGTLTGDDAVSSWAVNGTSGTYTSGNALTFSGFATLQGGTAVDTFTLGGATTFNLNGGDGVDVFALGGNTLTGAIAGQAAGGSITGIGSATLTNQGATTGFDGTSANVSGNFTDITSLAGTGTLTGDDVASTWALDGTPTYSDGTRTLDIAGFANLQGGTAADTFNVTLASTFNLLGGAGADVFTINAALTGSVSGETGSDTLQGTQIGSTTLTASTAADGFSGTTTGVTGFSGIDVLSGSGTLTGRDVASTWSVDAATYTDGTATLTHSGFGTLQGGTAIDTFNLAAAATANLLGGDGADVFNVNAALTGSVNGEVGNDILNGSTSYVVNAGNAGTATNVSAGFSNIENLAGTAGADTFTLSGAGTLAGTIDGLGGTDTLTGNNVANTWTITGPNSGTLTGTGGWSNIENLAGGTGTDSFSGVLAGSVGGTISDGGGGATTLSGIINSGGSQTYSAAVSSAGVTLNAGTAAISATNAGNNFTGTLDVTGSSASITDINALTIDASLTGGLITNSGALTYVAGMSVGSLNSTAGGAVNQTGAITVAGATSINAGGNAITLTSANDFQGAVSLVGGTTQVTDANALTLGNVNVGAFTTINTGALNLGMLNASSLTATTNGGNITQSGPANVTGATNLQAGTGSITLALANDFGGVVAASGNGITLNDVNTLAPGTINAGSGSVNLSANALGAGGTVSAGSASSFSSNTNVSGLDISMPNVPLALSGAATQWNLTSTPTSIAQPNPVTVPGGNVGVTYNLASIIASVAQQQAASASSSVSATVAAVIVDEANKTFGTDSVAEDVEYGFAGEVGATPPMDHRIDESGISLPRCVQESREGMPCK